LEVNLPDLYIFDLDGTVIDSDHRTPNNPDGTLNLEGYFAKKSRQNIFKDTLLPLAKVMRSAWEGGDYVAIATARDMGKDDYDYLAHHGLWFHQIIGRHHYRERLPEEPTPDEIWKSSQAYFKNQPAEIDFLPIYFKSDAEYKAAALRKVFSKPKYATCRKFMYEDAPKTIEYLRFHFPGLMVIDAKEENALRRAAA
jgi:hypothetical protein